MASTDFPKKTLSSFGIWTSICTLALLLHLVFIAFNYSNLPNTIPTHFNALGNADAWGAKSSIWFIWFLNLGIFSFLLGLERWLSKGTLATKTGLNLPEAWKKDSTGQIKTLLQEMFSTLNLLITVLFSAISGLTILTAHNYSTTYLKVLICIIILLCFLSIWIYYKRMANSQKNLSPS